MEFQEVMLHFLNLYLEVLRPIHRCFVLAGGYDAVWLLVFDPKDCPQTELPSTRVEGVWSHYTDLSVSPLLASESVAKGVRVENLEVIPGLKEIINVRGQ